MYLNEKYFFYKSICKGLFCAFKSRKAQIVQESFCKFECTVSNDHVWVLSRMFLSSASAWATSSWRVQRAARPTSSSSVSLCVFCLLCF